MVSFVLLNLHAGEEATADSLAALCNLNAVSHADQFLVVALLQLVSQLGIASHTEGRDNYISGNKFFLAILVDNGYASLRNGDNFAACPDGNICLDKVIFQGTRCCLPGFCRRESGGPWRYGR